MEATQSPGTDAREGSAPGTEPIVRGDGAEFGRMAVMGAVFGIPITFALLTLIFIGVGMNDGTAILAAIWPSLVGGPFFGLLFTQTRNVAMEHGEAATEARPRHKHGHKPHPAS